MELASPWLDSLPYPVESKPRTGEKTQLTGKLGRNLRLGLLAITRDSCHEDLCTS